MLDPQIISDPKVREIVRELTRRVAVLEAAARQTSAGSSSIDHGALSGLTDDDHSQYLNIYRHDTTERHAWANINKAGSSLADLATRSASDLSSGTLPDARFPATLPMVSGANLTALNATQLTAGTVPLARITGLLDANIDAAAAIAWSKLSKTGSSLADLTTRSAGDLSSGTLLDARLSTNVPLLNAGNTFTALVNTFKRAQFLAGATAGKVDIGRSAEEGTWGVANGAGNFLAGTAVGDVVFFVSDSAKKVHLGAGTGTAILVLTSSTATFNGVAYVKSYAKASLPAATTAGGLIYVSDEAGGAVLAFSDGANWRRVTDRAVVS